MQHHTWPSSKFLFFMLPLFSLTAIKTSSFIYTLEFFSKNKDLLIKINVKGQSNRYNYLCRICKVGIEIPSSIFNFKKQVGK